MGKNVILADGRKTAFGGLYEIFVKALTSIGKGGMLEMRECRIQAIFYVFRSGGKTAYFCLPSFIYPGFGPKDRWR